MFSISPNSGELDARCSQEITILFHPTSEGHFVERLVLSAKFFADSVNYPFDTVCAEFAGDCSLPRVSGKRMAVLISL